MLLGLDLGTTNVKALLAERDGRVVGRGAAPVRLIHTDDGGAEQDIEEIFASVVAAVHQAGRGNDLSRVEAVGVSSQGGALQILNEADQPVGRVISWLDGRRREYDRRIVEEMGAKAFFRRSGHPKCTMALGQLLRLRDRQPQLLALPNRIGFVGDVLVRRLCGRRAHDATSLSCAVLYNPAEGCADAELLRRAGISQEQLPDLLGPNDPAGTLTPAAAKATGLPVGIPVGPAVHDQYAAALGVGATAAGDVMFSAGTAWVLLAVSDRLASPAGGAGFVCRHVVDGLYGQILTLGNGGSAVNWALELTGLDAEKTNLDALLASVPAGADGLRMRPLLYEGGGGGLTAGTAGRLDGIRLGHGKAHLLRAVVEGLAMELTRYLGMLAEAGAAAERLIMCGGAAGSEITPQVIADATGLPVDRAVEPDAAAVGAAILARGLVEDHASLADLARERKVAQRRVVPGGNAAAYGEMFEQYISNLPWAEDR